MAHPVDRPGRKAGPFRIGPSARPGAYGTGLSANTIPGQALHPLERSFSFMRVWRKVRPGSWRIVLDVVLPYPEK
jgi:hypothetical protein